MLKRIVFVTVLFGISTIYGSIFTRGKAKKTIEYVYDCEGKEPLTVFNVRYDRCNKTHKCFNGNFTLPNNTDKYVTGDLEAQKWGDGGWKANAFKIHLPDACRNLDRILGKNWKELIRVSGVGNCPLAPGVYVVKDWYFNLDDLPVAFMYGKYRLIFQLNRFDQLILCKMFIINVA